MYIYKIYKYVYCLESIQSVAIFFGTTVCVERFAMEMYNHVGKMFIWIFYLSMLKVNLE